MTILHFVFNYTIVWFMTICTYCNVILIGLVLYPMGHNPLLDQMKRNKLKLKYKPKGRKNIGRPRKRWRDQLHLEDQGTGNTPYPSGT